MKVCVVTYLYPSEKDPGAGLFVKREVEALRRRGLEMEVVALPPVGGPGYFLPDFRLARRLARMGCDLVHAHGGLALGRLWPWRRRRVVTIHGSEATSARGRLFLRTFLRRDDTIIVVADHLRRTMRALRRAHVVPCGVDTTVFHATRRRSPVTNRRAAIGFPSDPRREEKNHPLFRAVCAELAGRGWDLDTVTIHGYDERALGDLLRGLDLVLYTSDREGSPVLSKEAMCCGARVVGPPVGDLPLQVDGFTGCAIAPAADARSLAAVTEECLALEGPDPSAAARRFSLEQEAEAVMGVYHKTW